jgi:alpha/beta hydrolase fold
MTATAQALRPPSRTLLLLEGRALQELGAFMLLRPWLAAAPRCDGHPVLVLPGLLASDFSTQPLRSFLKAPGYAVHGWKQGRNLGLRPGVEPDMLERVEELYDRHDGRKLSLVGWSLGGIYARQLAKLLPDKVRSVISLGSPFAGSPKATNAWKVYEFASGQSVEDRDGHIAGPLAEPPPVPTTSIFSRSDGICAWQTCVNEEREQVENIEVYGSHCGLGHHPAAVFAVADRLAQPEGQWKKFDRSGLKSLVFPDWRRA